MFRMTKLVGGVEGPQPASAGGPETEPRACDPQIRECWLRENLVQVRKGSKHWMADVTVCDGSGIFSDFLERHIRQTDVVT